MQPQVDTGAISALGIATIFLIAVAAGIQMWRTKKSFAEVVNDLFKRHNISIIMGVIFILNLAEAMMAASLLVANQKYSLNLVARYWGHLSISGASLACALMINDQFRGVLEIFKTNYGLGLKIGAFIVRLVRLVIVAGFAFILPVLNAMVIFNGLHETAGVRLLFASWFSDTNYYHYLLAKGNPTIGPGPLTIQYEPWDNLSYPAVTTIIITFIHIAFLWLDMLIVGDPLTYRQAKDADEETDEGEEAEENGDKKGEDNKKEETNEPKTSTEFEETLVKVLKFHGLSAEQLHKKYEASNNVLKEQADANRASIANALFKVYTKVEAFEKAGYQGAKYDEERNKVMAEIKKVFEASPSSGLGFGMSLPKPTKNV